MCHGCVYFCIWLNEKSPVFKTKLQITSPVCTYVYYTYARTLSFRCSSNRAQKDRTCGASRGCKGQQPWSNVIEVGTKALLGSNLVTFLADFDQGVDLCHLALHLSLVTYECVNLVLEPRSTGACTEVEFCLKNRLKLFLDAAHLYGRLFPPTLSIRLHTASLFVSARIFYLVPRLQEEGVPG